MQIWPAHIVNIIKCFESTEKIHIVTKFEVFDGWSLGVMDHIQWWVRCPRAYCCNWLMVFDVVIIDRMWKSFPLCGLTLLVLIIIFVICLYVCVSVTCTSICESLMCAIFIPMCNFYTNILDNFILIFWIINTFYRFLCKLDFIKMVLKGV